MSGLPKVSVVMPVFRPHPQYLAEAIDSVLQQTLRDWELIIVEDPSEQTGAAVVAQRNDPRIRYVLNTQRTALAQQHNRAVAEARAPFIARFDADDVCEPERLERQAAFLEQHPNIDIVASQVSIIDKHGAQIGVREDPQEHAEILRVLHRYNPISGSNAMFRASVPAAIGGWREGIDRPGQDYEWYSRAAARGHRFAILPEFLVKYRRHGEQIKARKLRGTLLTSLEVKRRYWLSSMDPLSLIVFLGEAVMLAMPVPFVLWLIGKVRYK